MQCYYHISWQLHQLILSIHYGESLPWIRNVTARRDKWELLIINWNMRWKIKRSKCFIRRQKTKFVIIRNHQKKRRTKRTRKRDFKQMILKWNNNEFLFFSLKLFLLICRHMLWRSMNFLCRSRIIKGHRQDHRTNNKALRSKRFVFGFLMILDVAIVSVVRERKIWWWKT